MWSYERISREQYRDLILGSKKPPRFETIVPWFTEEHYVEFFQIVDRNRIIGVWCVRHEFLFSNLLYLWSPAGPLFFSLSDNEKKLSMSFFSNILLQYRNEIEYKNKTKILWWRGEPEGISENEITSSFIRIKDWNPSCTLRLPLHLPIEEIESSWHHKVRYNIRVARRHNIMVRQIDNEDDAHEAIALILSTAHRDRYIPHSKSHYQTLWERSFHKNVAQTQNDPRILWWGAYAQDGACAAVAVTIEFGSVVTYAHGGSRFENRAQMPAYALHSTIIQNAHSRGFLWYDWYGIAPPNQEIHPLAGVTRFKKGFGGVLDIRPGTYDFIFYPFLYSCIRFLSSSRRVIRKSILHLN